MDIEIVITYIKLKAKYIHYSHKQNEILPWYLKFI